MCEVPAGQTFRPQGTSQRGKRVIGLSIGFFIGFKVMVVGLAVGLRVVSMLFVVSSSKALSPAPRVNQMRPI